MNVCKAACEVVDVEEDEKYDEVMCDVCDMMDEKKLLFKMPGQEDPCPMCADCEEEETMEACKGCMECVAAECMDAAAGCHAVEGDKDNEMCQAVAPGGDCFEFFA